MRAAWLQCPAQSGSWWKASERPSLQPLFVAWCSPSCSLGWEEPDRVEAVNLFALAQPMFPGFKNYLPVSHKLSALV